MNNHLLNIVFLLFSCAVAGQTKLFTPTKGNITFTFKEVVQDAEAMHGSENALVNDAAKTAEKEGTATDTAYLQQIAAAIKNDAVQPRNKKHFDFDKDLILAYETFEGKVRGDYMLIDQKTELYLMRSKKDSSFIYMKDKPYQYSSNRIITLKEFKNETKIIMGYKCFKVLATFKETDTDSGLFANANTYKELWVTDKIRCLYHPVLRDKAILEKYYPLEIKEYTDALKGIATLYTLDSITLK